MRVLHAIPSVSLADGGPSQAIATIERALSDAGISVTTVTTDSDGRRRRLGKSAMPAEVNGAERVYLRKWTDVYKVAPGAVPWLWRNVRRFDVIHIHALFSFTSVAAGAIACLRGVPFVVRPLGTLARYGVTQRRPLLKRMSLALIEGPILRRAGFVHCTSRSELEEARLHGVPFRGGVIPLGVDLPKIAASTSASRYLGPGGAGRRVLFLSRIDPKKNIEGLLRAFAIVARRRPGTVLRIAGAGSSEYISGLMALTKELSIAGSVEWLGHVEGDAKAASFASADVFVLPSFSENFGIAVVEAMLAGVPCIVGQGVGIAEESQAAGASLAVAPEPDAIADALSHLLEDDEGRRHMGEKARSWAEREYSTRTMALRLLDLYATLVAPPHQSVAA